MNSKERNNWYWNIMYLYGMELEKDFFELESHEINSLANIADAIRCKGENGKSPARTLWDRAKQGRPF